MPYLLKYLSNFAPGSYAPKFQTANIHIFDENMSIIDIILLICFIPALIGGIRKGLINQVVSIISFVLGVWMSFEFATLAGEWLSEYIEASREVLNIVAFALIIIVVSIVLSLAGKLLEGIFKLVHIGWMNRVLGGLFSLLKSALIIGLILMAFDSFNSNFHKVPEEVLAESILYEPIKNLAEFVAFPFLKGLFIS